MGDKTTYAMVAVCCILLGIIIGALIETGSSAVDFCFDISTLTGYEVEFENGSCIIDHPEYGSITIHDLLTVVEKTGAIEEFSLPEETCQEISVISGYEIAAVVSDCYGVGKTNLWIILPEVK